MTVQLQELAAQLESIRQEAQQALTATDSLDQLEQLRVKYLGKKGPIPQVLGGMGKLDAVDRPHVRGIANMTGNIPASSPIAS